jgi:hypothetical protein
MRGCGTKALEYLIRTSVPENLINGRKLNDVIEPAMDINYMKKNISIHFVDVLTQNL